MAQPRGKDGRWVKGGGGLLAVAVAIAIAAGSGAGGAGAVGTGSAGPGAVSTAKGNAKAKDRSTVRTVVRLEQRGLKVQERLRSDDTDCAAHSYGQVQAFFRSQPCAALFRALFEVRDAQQNVVLVAVAWADMPDSDQATALQRLVDGDGTGNITELSREGGAYRNVRFSGDYYESVRDGVTVVNAQAQPVGRAPAAAVLARIVESAVR